MAAASGSDILMLSPHEDSLAIPASKRPLIDDKKEGIEFYFRIAIFWKDDVGTLGICLREDESEAAMATLSLKGVATEREMATKYIQALYERGPRNDIVAVPIDMYAFVSAPPVLRHIVRESGAVVIVTFDGAAHVILLQVYGTEMAVTLAVSLFEYLTSAFERGINDSALSTAFSLSADSLSVPSQTSGATPARLAPFVAANETKLNWNAREFQGIHLPGCVETILVEWLVEDLSNMGFTIANPMVIRPHANPSPVTNITTALLDTSVSGSGGADGTIVIDDDDDDDDEYVPRGERIVRAIPRALGNSPRTNNFKNNRGPNSAGDPGHSPRPPSNKRGFANRDQDKDNIGNSKRDDVSNNSNNFLMEENASRVLMSAGPAGRPAGINKIKIKCKQKNNEDNPDDWMRDLTPKEVQMIMENSENNNGNKFKGPIIAEVASGSSSSGTASVDPPLPNWYLRRVVIDGSNVAMEHGGNQRFSCRGIWIAVQFFLARGHEPATIKVYVPQWRQNTHNAANEIDEPELLRGELKDFVSYTPCRVVDGVRMNSYDDRFILQTASANRGVVVSNDKFRDLWNESLGYQDVIKHRLLPFAFAEDVFLPAPDPMGTSGPKLDEFLKVYRQEMESYPHSRPRTFIRRSSPPQQPRPPLQQQMQQQMQQQQHQQHHQQHHQQQQQSGINFTPSVAAETANNRTRADHSQLDGRLRTREETIECRTELRKLFSANGLQIDCILEAFPAEKDLNNLAAQVLSMMPV